MIEGMIEYNGKTIFDHDEEMFDLIYSTAAIMYFPNEVKDRCKRELYRKAFDHKTSAHVKSNKLDKSLFEARKKGYMAGEFFFRRCQMALFMGKAPSLNQMYYATQEEFYDKWRENFPVGSIKPLCRTFAPVLHLWSAYRYFQFSAEKVEFPEYYLLLAPLDFLKLATIYRECAVGCEMVDSLSDLWMPQGLKKAELDWIFVEAFFETKVAYKEGREFKSIFQEYRNGRFWEY